MWRAATQRCAKGMSEISEGEKRGDLAVALTDRTTYPAPLITGEHDLFAPPLLLQPLAARIPRAETRIVDGVGHDVQNSDPTWPAHTILDWLERH
jgi:pimeloyl-ACP methyl ester carboxylesterase